MTETHRFEHSSVMPAAAEAVFAWHERPGAFERLNAPWKRVRIITRSGPLTDGSQVTLGVPLGPLFLPWKIAHQDYERGRQFRDVQVHGPFSHWEHLHRFEPTSETSSILRDEIHFDLPFGNLGLASYLKRELERLFLYRHAVTAHDVAVHARYSTTPEQIVYISGATGFIGSALYSFLSGAGHRVLRLSRATPKSADDILWSPAETPSFKPRETPDTVIHLAGEPLFSRRWDEEKKRRIRTSRVQGTRNLCETLAQMPEKPKTLICASAVGIYGDRGEEVLTEASAPGEGFLAEVTKDWEQSVEPALAAGIRVVIVRIGIVLSPQGGALRQMLLPFSAGLGGQLGNGRHFISWVALDDLLAIFEHLLSRTELSGVFTAVSPSPVTNRDFTKTLGKVLHRPTIMPVPKKAAQVIFGELADEALFMSTRVMPNRLFESGFAFSYPTLEEALRHCLGRRR